MNTQAELLNALDDVSQRLFALLDTLNEDQLDVPLEPGINPPIWELGHAAFFYELFVLRALDHTSPDMPGYDEIWDSFEIKHSERWREGVVPDKSTTVDYYHRILDAVRKRISAHEPSADELYLYRYAIYHHHMHVESLIWCRQTLAQAKPPTYKPAETTEAKRNEDTDTRTTGDAQIPGGYYSIGLPAPTNEGDEFAASHFGFDSEKPGYEKNIDPFAISKTLVSNREFIEFVEAGMYQNPDVWSYGGRNWLRDTAAHHPAYWRQESGHWMVRLFDQWQALVADAPVIHVSFWEAEAYARWRGRRLPTEFEWEAAARGPEGRLYPWGEEQIDASKVDMDAVCLGQNPVTAYPAGASPYGCLQMLGTAWEWTTSQFLPYPGFVTDMYPYMSTLQFGDHKVARGGSCSTSSCLMRNTYRQAYHPDRRDVFTGFRTCALD